MRETLRAALLVASVAVAGCASATVSFENATPGAALRIPAEEFRPHRSGVFPAVVLMHGCHGVSESNREWGRWFAEQGYVALVVDSWRPRGLSEACTPGEELPSSARFDDAIGALRWLQGRPYVDREHVGIIGWSNGGVFAMAAVNGPTFERTKKRGVVIPEPGFRAAVGVYPGGCFTLANELSVRPLLLLVGSDDDWTLASECVELTQKQLAKGADVTLVIYPGAVHYFDVVGQPRTWLADVENRNRPNNCCGATVGYDAAAAADAHQRVAEFFGRHLGCRDNEARPRLLPGRVRAVGGSGGPFRGPTELMDASVEFVRHLLQTVVNIHVAVPKAHPSARILGNERMGSGIIIDAAGLILTVNYVVMGAQTVEVGFLKGRRVKAEIVGQDFETGIALIRVKRQGLVPAPLATPVGELERGQPVVSVASTGPQERRVGGGVITYLGEFEAYWEYLLDRGIVSSAQNPGFGGGALYSMTGALLGVLYLNLNEVARGSLAIPVDFYREHENELLRFGRVTSRPRRAWLGVFAHAIEEGVVVAGIVPEGPGDRGGLQEGDIIVSLEAQEVGSRKDLYQSLWRHEPGERLTLEVLRDSKTRRVEITTGDRAEFFKQP